MTGEFGGSMVAQRPPRRRGRPPKVREVAPEPAPEPVVEQLVEVTLPNGAKAMVPMSTMKSVPPPDYDGEPPNFRCMYRNTTEPTGHPDFYARRAESPGGYVSCPLCGNTAVLQIGQDDPVMV